MSSSYCDDPDVSCLQQQQAQQLASAAAGGILSRVTSAANVTTLASAAAAFSVSDILHCPSYDDDDDDENQHQNQRQQRQSPSSGVTGCSPESATVHSHGNGLLPPCTVVGAVQHQQQRPCQDCRPGGLPVVQTASASPAQATVHYRSSVHMHPATGGFAMSDGCFATTEIETVGSHNPNQNQYPCGGSSIDELFQLHPSSAGSYHQVPVHASSSADLLSSSGSPPSGPCNAWYAAMTAGYGDDVTSAASRHACEYIKLCDQAFFQINYSLQIRVQQALERK